MPQSNKYDVTAIGNAIVDVLAQADVIVICVPTPLTEAREPDLSYIVRTGEMIRPHLRPGQLVVLESTTYPGTTREVLQHRFSFISWPEGRPIVHVE